MNQEKELNKSLKLIVKSSMFVFIGFALAKILGYLYRIIIARYFGPEVYGLFSLTIMILLWFVSFFSLGFFDGILRFIPIYRGKKETKKIRYIIRFSLLTLFLSGILAGFLLYALSEFISINILHDPSLILFLKISSFSIPFYILSYTLLAIINAYENIKAHTFISDFLFNFIKLVFLVLFIILGIGINGIIFSYMLGMVGIFFIAYFYSRYKISEIFGKSEIGNSEKKILRNELFLYSWPLIFLGIISTIFPYIDSFVLAYFKTTYDVGIYNAAVPIAELMTFVPALFIRLFFPLATREFYQKNFEVVEELSKQVQKWILIAILPFFLMMVIFPGAFLNIIFGSEYISAENSLRILTIGFLFSSLITVSYYLIMMVGKTKIIFVDIIIGSILNLILSIILIPKYGINGAAIATTISNIIMGLLFFFQANYYTGFIPLRRNMLKITISSIIPTLLLLYSKQFVPINLINIIFQASFFLLFYLFLIFITKSLDKNDFMILNAFKRKIKDELHATQ